MKPTEAAWCNSPVKPQITEIVGKKIAGVVVKENVNLSPPRQVFLIFDDGSNFEFYASSEMTWRESDPAASTGFGAIAQRLTRSGLNISNRKPSEIDPLRSPLGH